MKGLMKTAAAMAVFVVTQQAGAIGVTFNFRVNSSGPSIYPCNAGLLTPDRNPKVCFIAGTNTRCTPSCTGEDCKPTPPQPPHPSSFYSLFGGQGGGGPECHGNDCGGGGHQTPPPEANSCVCTTSEGDTYANYFQASYGGWDETGDPTVEKPSGIDAFNRLFGEKEAYGKTLKKLTINLGNELYNARYFVDICYRGPQIDYRDIETQWDLFGKVSVTDFGYQNGGHGYKSLSELQGKAYVVCDEQKDDCPSCNDANPVTDPNSAIFNDGSDFLSKSGPHGARYDFGYEGSNKTTLPSSLTEMFHLPDAFRNHGKRAPRFCKIRYVFSETNGLHEHTAILRKWQKHGAQVCTYSQIEATGIGSNDHGHGHGMD